MFALWRGVGALPLALSQAIFLPDIWPSVAVPFVYYIPIFQKVKSSQPVVSAIGGAITRGCLKQHRCHVVGPARR